MTMADVFVANASSLNAADSLPAGVADFLNAESSAIVDAADEYQKLRDYWEGNHPVKLTDRLKQFLEISKLLVTDAKGAETGRPFSFNLMGVVVSAMTDRMTVANVNVPGEAPPEDAKEGEQGPLATLANDIWQLNRCDAMQADVHDAAAALGDAYIIVDFNDELEHATLDFNPPELVRIVYDPGKFQEPLYAVKRWVVTEQAADGGETSIGVRMNIYWPDRIEKYSSKGPTGTGNWIRVLEAPGEDDDESVTGTFPLWWTDTGEQGGEPLGIPVIHYRNNPRGKNYGRSELVDVIPIQDTANKGLVDGVKTMDSQGWPQRWATGVDVVPNTSVAAEPGAIITSRKPDAKFGQFDAASAADIVTWLEKVESMIATISATPQHLFRVVGGAPSGEALKTAEAPLVEKVEKRMTVYGNAWEDALGMAMKLTAARSGESVGELPDSGLAVEWAPAETLPNEKERIESINAKQGISNRQRLREYGYTNEQIETITAELEEEPDDLADGLARAFNRGNDGGPATGGRETNDGNE